MRPVKIYKARKMAAFGSGMRISQETFDDVVRENVEDFEMEKEEALAEAINQFKSQGVDLSNVDLTGGAGREEMQEAMKALKQMATDNVVYDVKNDTSTNKYTGEEVEAALRGVMALCDAKKCELFERNRKMMNPDGLNSLHSLLVVDQHQEILRLALNFLNVLSKESVECRDFFEPGGSKKVTQIIANQLDMLVKGGCDLISMKVLKAALSLAKTAAKSENNKSMLARSSLCEVLGKLVTMANEAPAVNSNTDTPEAASEAASVEWQSVINETCSVIRGLCIHDDLRKEMSCAMDNGKFFLSSNGVVAALMQLSGDFKSNPTTAGNALSAAKTMVTTEDAVKKMASHGAMELPTKVLAFADNNDAESSLVRYCLGLMRNLCADDIRKNTLVDNGTMQQMLGVMSNDIYAADSMLMEHGAACLAAMSLRQPANAAKIAQVGGVDIMVKAMRKHEKAGGMQRQCSLCIRNIAGRCPELRQMLLDAGCEDVLRLAGRLQDAVDEAYGALRDLNCEVNRVKINEDGSIEAAVEQFGEKKASFKAVWDDSTENTRPSNIEERIQDAAQAPFAGGHGASRPGAASTVTYAQSNKKPFEDEDLGHYGQDDDLMETGTSNAKAKPESTCESDCCH